MDTLPYVASRVMDIVCAVRGQFKKCLILDLDNTVWGGVIGDDGVDGIRLGPEEPVGQGYSEFQRYLKEHKQLGVILNIDSKNDFENAIAGLNHPDSDLHEEDFIDISIHRHRTKCVCR